MSEPPKHDCASFCCESDPDHCVIVCNNWRDWAEKELNDLRKEIELMREVVAAARQVDMRIVHTSEPEQALREALSHLDEEQGKKQDAQK